MTGAAVRKYGARNHTAPLTSTRPGSVPEKRFHEDSTALMTLNLLTGNQACTQVASGRVAAPMSVLSARLRARRARRARPGPGRAAAASSRPRRRPGRCRRGRARRRRLVPGAPGDPAGLAATPPMGVTAGTPSAAPTPSTRPGCAPRRTPWWPPGCVTPGYRYVDLDDCWAAPRSATPRAVWCPTRSASRTASPPSPTTCTRAACASGIYTSAGTLTCDARGFPASLGHETADAASFAAWGVDDVKEDDCSTARHRRDRPLHDDGPRPARDRAPDGPRGL